MWWEVFFRGFLIGVVASVPLGPVGVLCIQRTLSKGTKSGFISGLGAATGDTIYAAMAFFSLTFVMTFLQENMSWFTGIGGVLIMIIGGTIFFKDPVVQIRHNRSGKSNLWQNFLSVFLLALANPVYILVFVALFATFGLKSNSVFDPSEAAMIAGVFSGAASWWLLLTSVVGMLRRKFKPVHLVWINRISGGLIFLLGALTLLSSIVNFHLNAILPFE